jgi:hypothetical protein
VATPLTRRIAVLLAGVLLYTALVGAADSAEPARLAAEPGMHLRTLSPHVSLGAGRLAQAGLTYRGGPITTSTGDTVDVRVSDTLPLETSTPEGWAEFLAQLTHGPELAELTTFIVSFDEVQEICGSMTTTAWWRPVRWSRTSRRRRSCGTNTATTSPTPG